MGFRTDWEAFGGPAVYGYPITEEFTDSTGVTVQWFERARFEWRPGTRPERYDVHLGRIGVELAERVGIGPTARQERRAAGSRRGPQDEPAARVT